MSKCQHNWESRCVDPGLPDCLICKVEKLEAVIESQQHSNQSLARIIAKLEAELADTQVDQLAKMALTSRITELEADLQNEVILEGLLDDIESCKED